jgi:predicted phosphodiesterase
MRVAVIADIHGNYSALEAVFADIEKLGIDDIISLGDNVGYGPEPEEVVQALLQRNVFSVMGNHELGLISVGYFNRLNPGAQESLEITKGLLSQESLCWLGNLPAVYICHGARFVHGCPPQSMTAYLFSPSANRLQRIFSTYPEIYCFAGHTHNLSWFTLRDNIVTCSKLKTGMVSLSPDSRHLILPGSHATSLIQRQNTACGILVR